MLTKGQLSFPFDSNARPSKILLSFLCFCKRNEDGLTHR